MTRTIEVEGSYNIRDLGGFPTEDGRTTRWHVLIRAGALDKVTPKGEQQLVAYGMKTIVDLRDEFEVRDYPDVFAQNSSVQYHHKPLSPHSFSDDLTYSRLDEMYRVLLGGLKANIRAIAAVIADAEPGIVFHCYAGKDRTGVVAALLLGVAGVSNSLIAEDYAATSHHIAHLVAQWREYAVEHGQDMERFACDVGADAVTMLNTLDDLKQRYGGVPDYLRDCGVTDGQLARLRTLLVE